MPQRARFCMACGAPLAAVREEGQVRRRCRRCGWTFYDNPVPAVLGIAERGQRVLLARRAAPPHRGTWDLPGGFLEAGETPERALVRELREESSGSARRPAASSVSSPIPTAQAACRSWRRCTGCGWPASRRR